MQVFLNHSVKQLNTFGIDAKAKKLIITESDEDIKQFLDEEKESGDQLLILGGGSNVLFLGDYEGIILKNNCKGIRVLEKINDDVLVEANAGELWDDLVTFAVANEFYGIENLKAIPGTVGAAPVQNIGAYGVELKDCFCSLTGIDLETKQEKEFTKEDCGFDYRDSIFKKDLKNNFLITKVRLKLSLQKKTNLNYRALKEEFKNKDVNDISIHDVSAAIRRIRESKLPDVSKYGNAGSFFKNPEITEDHYMRIKEKYPNIVAHQTENKKYKLASAWLIEQCGFKGIRNGNVGSYEKQPLVLINYGKATGLEIKKFSEEIKKSVFNKFGVTINPEVNFI